MQARSLLRYVPRGVAVVANRNDSEWSTALRACDIQLLTVSIFERADETTAVEAEGSLYVPTLSIGFFTYFAVNRSFRMPLTTNMDDGEIQIEDPFGSIGLWIVRRGPDVIWVTKNIGDPGIPDSSMLQVVRTETGRITLRLHT